MATPGRKAHPDSIRAFQIRLPGLNSFLPAVALVLLVLTWVDSALAQDNSPTSIGSRETLNQVQLSDELAHEPRELTVLSPTLASEEIDRAVLNRLMSEIATDPDTVSRRLGVSDSQLEDIYITVSNARNFINNNEMANIRSMCTAWNNSTLDGEGRIEEALDAYKARRQFTREFIAKYYRVIVADIEALLPPPALVSFRAYMEDRRRRMANAGGTFGAVVENVSSGRESIEFNCRSAR